MKRTTVVVVSIVALAVVAFVAGRATGKSGGNPQTATRRVLYYVDPMHPAYKSDKPGIAPDCGMALEPVYEGESGSTKAALPPGSVSLSPEYQQMIGVRVETVAKSSGSHTVRTTGRVTADDNYAYRLMAGTEGWIRSLQSNPPGTFVKKNQVLASYYAQNLLSAAQTYVFALQTNAQSESENATLGYQRASTKLSLQVALDSLRALGMSEFQIEEIGKTRTAPTEIQIYSPVSGIVLSRSISPHQRFEKGTELYRIADLRKVWIIADLRGNDSEFRPGTRAKVTIPESGITIEATVSSDTPLFDPTSRTLKLRLVADNPRLLLRPDMFVDVEFQAKVPVGLSVPAEAVLDSGMRKIVYLETSDGVFEPHTVEIASAYGDRVTIAKGVAEGNRIVVAGNFLLDSESRMRATSLAANASRPEVKTAIQREALRDPVCGMTLSHSDPNLVERYQGETYSFCSESCRKKFQDHPGRYVGDKAARVAIEESQTGRQTD